MAISLLSISVALLVLAVPGIPVPTPQQTPDPPSPPSPPSPPIPPAGDPVDEDSGFNSRHNAYFVVLGAAIIIVMLGLFFFQRHRRNIARANAWNSHAALQRDMAALSESFYRANRSRTRSDDDFSGVAVIHGSRPTGRRERRTRNGGNSLRRDPDGLHLDVDESGEAPPPYVKETDDTVKQPNVRTGSAAGDTEILGEVTRSAEGVEMQTLGGSSLPQYSDLQRPAPAKLPA